MEHLNECKHYYIEYHPPHPLIESDSSSSSNDDDNRDDPFDLDHPDGETHYNYETIVDFEYDLEEYLNDPNSDPNLSPSYSY